MSSSSEAASSAAGPPWTPPPAACASGSSKPATGPRVRPAAPANSSTAACATWRCSLPPRRRGTQGTGPPAPVPRPSPGASGAVPLSPATPHHRAPVRRQRRAAVRRDGQGLRHLRRPAPPPPPEQAPGPARGTRPARRRPGGRHPVLGRPGRRRPAHPLPRPHGHLVRGTGCQPGPRQPVPAAGRAGGRRRRHGPRERRRDGGRAKQVINATGVWTDDTQAMAGTRGQFHVRASKGVYLLVPRDRINSAPD